MESEICKDLVELNKDHKRRYEIIKNGMTTLNFSIGETIHGEDEAQRFGGIIRFEINLKQLNMLFNEKFIDPNGAQNDSPTAQEFKDWAVQNINAHSELEKHLYFIGYAISASRSDYRVSIEGIIIHTVNYDVAKDIIISFANNFFSADEFYISPESMRCWYD
jgi:hypothetical protein